VDCSPRYLLCGGLIFVPLSCPWINEVFKNRQLPSWVQEALETFPEEVPPESELVVLSKVLAHDCNFGFQTMRKALLLKFNGASIKNLSQLSKLLQESKEDFYRFQFDHDMTIVLERKHAQDAEAEILEQHSIAAVQKLEVTTTEKSGTTAPEQTTTGAPDDS
jgi:hypothetical protein